MQARGSSKEPAPHNKKEEADTQTLHKTERCQHTVKRHTVHRQHAAKPSERLVSCAYSTQPSCMYCMRSTTLRLNVSTYAASL
jgi:hypothetical protein